MVAGRSQQTHNRELSYLDSMPCAWHFNNSTVERHQSAQFYVNPIKTSQESKNYLYSATANIPQHESINNQQRCAQPATSDERIQMEEIK
jgi:hypothetical protein